MVNHRSPAGNGWRAPRRASAARLMLAATGHPDLPVSERQWEWLQMTAGSPSRPLRRPPRQELAIVLLLGAAGAGLVLPVMRQCRAQVSTAAARPLPACGAAVPG